MNINQKTYTIISAVYNVDKYLDKYFKSIVKQSLGFEENINIILVDDGSTDNSATVIKKWRYMYPDNILYIKKQNGGQSSARNLGLKSLSTPWVTFVDPDDFLDVCYFEEVDKFIEDSKLVELSMIGTALHFYFDKYGISLDMHPLKYRFEDNKKIFSTKDLKANMQLSASSAFFRSDLIHKTNLKFDEKVKPNFEDAHFVNKYLIENYKSSVSFLKSAKYNYRKRSVGNSTIDGVWIKKELYDDVLYYGCLDLFKLADKKLGYIPKYLQRTVLYHLSWYYKYLVDDIYKLSFLSQKELDRFEALLLEIFTYIEVDTIKSFELVVDNFVKLAWLYRYKKIIPTDRAVEVYRDKNIYRFTFFSFKKEVIRVKIDDNYVDMGVIDKEQHTFLYKEFINSYSLKIPLVKKSNSVAIEFNNGFIYRNSVKSIKSKTMINLKIKLKNVARKLLLG